MLETISDLMLALFDPADFVDLFSSHVISRHTTGLFQVCAIELCFVDCGGDLCPISVTILLSSS